MLPSSFPPVPSMLLRQLSVILYFSVLHCRGAPIVDEYSCNVCRDPPQEERYLINPDKKFTQSNGRDTTCGELQEWVQDVQPIGGSPGEAELCGLTQYLAWFHKCDCVGPDIPSPEDNVNDPNASCDICGASDLDFNHIPEPNREKLTDTICCGKQNCDGLYLAAAQGVLSSTLCPIVQKNSGPECCNLDIASGPLSGPNVSPSSSPLSSPSHSPSDAPYSNPTDDPTTNICNQRGQKKACITTFGCSWQKKKRKSKGKCKTALETAQCPGKKRSGCIRKGCVWRKSDKRCLGRWS
jgi:hypothetical protein